MMTTPDAVSDALVATLTAGAPAGTLILDHEPLPVKAEEIPTQGLLGIFLFEDGPVDDDGVTDSVGGHDRVATFKVEGRIAKSPHLLHGTKALRAVLAAAIKANPTLGNLASDTRLGPMHVLVHENNSAVGAFSQDVRAYYFSQPE